MASSLGFSFQQVGTLVCCILIGRKKRFGLTKWFSTDSFMSLKFGHKKHGHLGQVIQEWTKENLWKTAFKKFEVIWSA